MSGVVLAAAVVITAVRVVVLAMASSPRSGGGDSIRITMAGTRVVHVNHMDEQGAQHNTYEQQKYLKHPDGLCERSLSKEGLGPEQGLT